MVKGDFRGSFHTFTLWHKELTARDTSERSIYFFLACMELPQDAVIHLFGNGVGYSLDPVLGTQRGKVRTDALELLPGLKHGTGILGIVLQEEY